MADSNLVLNVETNDAANKIAEMSKRLDDLAGSAGKVEAPAAKAEEAIKSTGTAATEATDKVKDLGTSISDLGDKFAPLAGSSKDVEDRIAELSKMASAGSDALKGLTSSTGSADAALREANAGANLFHGGLTSILGNVGSAVGGMNLFRGSADEAGRAAANTAVHFSNLERSAFGLATGMRQISVAAVTIALLKLAEDAAQSADRMGDLQTKLIGMTGSAQLAQDRIRELQKTAADLGIPIKDATEHFLKLGAAERDAGRTTADAETAFRAISTVTKGLGGDNKEAMQATDDFAKALRAGADGGSTFAAGLHKIDEANGTVILQRLAAQMGTTQSALLNGSQSADAMAQGMLKLSQATDIATNAGKGFGDSWNRIKDALSGALDRFTESFSKAFAQLVPADVNTQKLVDGLAKLADILGTVAGWLVGSFVEGAIKLGEAFSYMADRALAAWQAIVNFGTGVMNVFTGIVDIGRGVLDVLTGIATFDWGRIKLGLGEISKGATEVGTAFDVTKPKAADALDTMIGKGEKAAETLIKLGETVKGVSNNWDALTRALLPPLPNYFKPNNDGTFGPQMTIPGQQGGGGGGGGSNNGRYVPLASGIAGPTMEWGFGQGVYGSGQFDPGWGGSDTGSARPNYNQPWSDRNNNPAPQPVQIVDSQGSPIGTATSPLFSSGGSPDIGGLPSQNIGSPNAGSEAGREISRFIQAERDAEQRQQAGIADEAQRSIDLVTGMQTLGANMGDLRDTTQSASDVFMSTGFDLVDGLTKDVNSTDLNTGKIADNTFQCVENTIGMQFNTSALAADTAANYQDAASQGGAAGGQAGGGLTGQDQGGTAPNQNNFGNNGTDPSLYLDTGGIIGGWGGRQGPSVPLAAWANAPHFADGGLTGGGIPIIAHPGEAVVPLKGGAIPVDLSGIVSGETTITQAIKDAQQTIINVGTLAHTDAGQAFAQMKIINDTLVAMEAAAASSAAASAASSALNSVSAASLGGGISQGGGSTNSGTGKFMRGFWGTSTNGGYLPQTSTNAYQSGGQYYDANGKLINTGGAAEGLENTNSLPGMSAAGVPLMVHQDEAVVNLNGGGRIPVELRGGQSPGNTTIVHQHFNVSVPQDMFGRGASSDQIAQRVGGVVNDAVRRFGTVSQIDDPTVRVTDTRRGGNLI